MRRMLAAAITALTLVGTMAVTPLATAATPVDPDLDGIVIPDGAEITKIVEEDFTFIVVTAPIPESEQLHIAAGREMTVNSGEVETHVVGLSATCTQSNSVALPELVTTAPRRMRAYFKFTNGSGCGRESITGQLWGNDPLWGYQTVAGDHTTLLSPGFSSSFYATFNCKSSSSSYWFSRLLKGSFIVNDTAVKSRACHR